MSLLVERFAYPSLTRDESSGVRLYECMDGNKVPSVTTILSATKSSEAKASLENWRNRVGEENAKRIMEEASERGTFMHAFLEEYIAGRWAPSESKTENILENQASRMAMHIIRDAFHKVDEVWGSEVPLFYPGIYAGTTDCVGIHDGKQAIMDYKQTNKPKRREWIDDYFIQLTMYGNAHNELYGTNINTGVIMMAVAPPPENPNGKTAYQEFIITGSEWNYYTNLMWNRVEKYYGMG